MYTIIDVWDKFSLVILGESLNTTCNSLGESLSIIYHIKLL